jgi:hypothetical protein
MDDRPARPRRIASTPEPEVRVAGPPMESVAGGVGSGRLVIARTSPTGVASGVGVRKIGS